METVENRFLPYAALRFGRNNMWITRLPLGITRGWFPSIRVKKGVFRFLRPGSRPPAARFCRRRMEAPRAARTET